MIENNVRLLVVDDERPIRRFLFTSLGSQYTVLEASNGSEALASVVATHPDAVILDMGLPDMDGLEVIRRLREWSRVPIIIISVRDQEREKIAALDSGADDYLTKPFGIGELIARIRVSLRHTAQPESGPVFEHEDLEVDLSRRMVKVKNHPVTLTPTEYEILRLLIQSAGKVITHRQLIHSLWGEEEDEEAAHLVRVNVSNLRRKIESDPTRPRHILTEAGVGYRLHSD
jgi:two-component system, OmpR family, KDP operon response regulator KdpE